MDEPILETIKKLLGCENIDEFDEQLIILINGAIDVLIENGVGNKKGFMITENNETWADLITNDNKELFNLCKTYIYLEVKILFDTTSMSSYVLNAIKEKNQEYLWRIREQAEPADYFEVNEEEGE